MRSYTIYIYYGVGGYIQYLCIYGGNLVFSSVWQIIF